MTTVEEMDPYITGKELEISDLFANQSTPSRPQHSSHTTKSPFFVRVVAILFAFVALLIKMDIKVDTQLMMGAQDDEEKMPVHLKDASLVDASTTDQPPPWKYMRWQLNETEEDNCIPGFHLADTKELACGQSVANSDITYLTQHHNGSAYCAGVPYVPNACIEPRMGYWKLPSDNVSEIPPLPFRLGVGSYDTTSKLPRCISMEQYLSNGTIVSNTKHYPPTWIQSANKKEQLSQKLTQYDQEYQPQQCSSIPLNPFVWTENSSCQTTITMYGDSHIRNLFTATVFGLRGIEAFAEGHADASSKESGIIYSYEWRMHHDGTADDKFEFHSGIDFKNSTYRVSHCSCDESVKRCLRIFFVWAPTMDEQFRKFDYVERWETDLLIVEPGNSYDKSPTIHGNWRSKLDELLNKDKHLRLGILHWPWGGQPANERTESVNAWIHESSNADRMAYMRQDDILFTPGLQGRASFHFACGLSQVNVKNDKIVAAEPCTDQPDTSQIRALTTVLFDAFKDGKR